MANPQVSIGGMTVTVPTQSSGPSSGPSSSSASVLSPAGSLLAAFGAAPMPGQSVESDGGPCGNRFILTNISRGGPPPYTFSLQILAAQGRADPAPPGQGYALNVNLAGQGQSGPFDVVAAQGDVVAAQGDGAGAGGYGYPYGAVPAPSLTATPLLIGNVPAIQLAGY